MSKKKAKEKTFIDLERYQELRIALREHQQEWERAARQFPNLYFEWIQSPTDVLSDDEWHAFITENTSHVAQDDWQDWIVYEVAISCGRFTGDPSWFEIFKRMAQATNYIIWEEFSECLGPTVELPDGVLFERRSPVGYDEWIDLVFDTAKAATPMLHWIGHFWNVPEEWPVETQDERSMDAWGTSKEGVRFPLHPHCVALPHNVFRSSAEAIRYWLNPDQIPKIGICLGESPIRLPAISDVSPKPEFSKDRKRPFWRTAPRQKDPTILPRFKLSERTLMLGDFAVKTFDQPAFGEPPENQELLIINLQKAQWAQRIPNPLSDCDDPDAPKSKEERLNQAVRDFNRRQDTELFKEAETGGDITHIFRLEHSKDKKYVSWYLIDLAALTRDTA